MRRFLTFAAVTLAILLTGVLSALPVIAEGWPSWGEVSTVGSPSQQPPQIQPETAAWREKLSTHIVIGKVTQVITDWWYTPEGGRESIYTEATIDVESVLKGTLDSSLIVVREGGGVLDGLGQITDVTSLYGGWRNAEFSEGEVVKLYLNLVTQPTESHFLLKPMRERAAGPFFEVVCGQWGKELLPDSETNTSTILGSSEDRGYWYLGYHWADGSL